jgi:hypothetical protein
MSIILFSTIKFFIIIIGLVIIYTYLTHVVNIIKEDRNVSIIEIISTTKYRLLFIIFYIFLVINVFNMETSYRPKTSLNMPAPKMIDINKEVVIKKIVPENFKSDIKKSHDENKEAIEHF